MKIDQNKEFSQPHIKVLKEMFKLLLKYKKLWFILLIISSMLINLLPYISIILTQQLLNSIQTNQSVEFILFVLSLYLVVKIITLILTNYYNYLNKKYNDFLVYNLNVEFLQKCQFLKYKDFENDKIYDMLLRANQQISTSPSVLITGVISLVGNILGLVTSAIILISWHWWIVFGYIFMPILAYKHFVLLNKNEYEIYCKRTPLERLSWYYSQLLIKDYFIKEIKTLNATNYIHDKFKTIKENIYIENIELNKKRTFFNLIYQLLNLLFSFLVIVISVLEVIANKILIGDFMTYINTMSKVENTISNITNAFYSIYTNVLYFSHLTTFFSYTKNNEEIETKKSIENIEMIEIHNLYFKYPGSNKFVLKNLNIKVKKGDIIALVGENGSGKSTLLKILTGLYDEYKGEIFLDGIELREIDKVSLAKNISAIFQDFNSYEFNVKDNIGLGDVDNINDIEKINQAAKLSGADKFIKNFPMKYNQQLGNWFPGGIQISGGQWQKIAIARVLMRNSEIFILDEPTGSLDPTAEYTFLQNFVKHTNNKISIFATHRFMNALIATQIIVLKEGEIIETGSHKELIHANGEYSRLFNLQVKGGNFK